MQSRKALQAISIVTVVAMGAAVTPVLAQNSPKSGVLSFGTSVDYDTNPNLVAAPAGGVFGVSENLSFSFRTENSTQFLEFTGNTGVSFSSTVGGGSGTSVSNPQGTIHYFRGGANSDLDVQTGFWSGSVITAFDNDPTSVTNIIVDTGTLSKTSADLVANWGLGAPLSFSFSANLIKNEYSGTTDPALFNSEKLVLGAAAKIRISPTTQGDFSLVRTAYSSSDAFSSHSETADYVFKLSHQASASLSLNANVGYQIQSSTVSGATRVSDGLFGGFGFVQELSNGNVFGDLSYDGTGAADSGSVSVGRSFDFPLGNVTGSLTADWADGRGTQVLGSASLQRQFPDGTLDFQLSQTITTDSLSQDIKYTYVGIAYQKTLNSDSGIDLSLNLSHAEDAGTGSAADIDRATITTSYSRQLNSDWNMSVGYRNRRSSGSGVATATSDSVFFTLTKNLQFGF